MKVKCIYCLEENEVETQRDREHIFPKTYGGQRRLEKGVVCDKCNNEFSKFELDFARNSLLSLPKQFYQPVSKKAKKGKITQKLQVIETPENEFCLGYIQEGKPLYCPQIVARKTHASFIYFLDFIKNLDLIINTNIDKVKFIKHSKIKKNEPIIGIYNKKVVAYYNDDEDEVFIRKFKNSLIKNRQEVINQYNPDKITKKEHQVIVHQEYSFDLDNMNRTIVKIVLNTIAHYFGDEVYKEYLNILREYVKGSQTNHNPVILLNEQVKSLNLQSLFKDIANNHYVMLGKLHEKFPNTIGIVSFYDGSFVFAVSLKNQVPDTLKCIKGLPFRLLVVNYKRNDEYGDYELFENSIIESNKMRKNMSL